MMLLRARRAANWRFPFGIWFQQCRDDLRHWRTVNAAEIDRQVKKAREFGFVMLLAFLVVGSIVGAIELDAWLHPEYSCTPTATRVCGFAGATH